MRYEGAVLALTPPALARLLGDAAPYGIEHLDAFEAFPIIDVHLWHDGGAMGFDFAALLGSGVQWVFEKDPGYLCASMSAAGAYTAMSTQELADVCWSEIAAAIPSLRNARVIERSVTRNPNATYLPALGARRPGQRTRFARVAIAGAWTNTGWPDTMEARRTQRCQRSRCAARGTRTNAWRNGGCLNTRRSIARWNGFSNIKTRKAGGAANSRPTSR